MSPARRELEYYKGWCRNSGANISTVEDGSRYTSTILDAKIVDGKKRSDVPTVGGCSEDQSVLNLFRHIKGMEIKTWRGNFNTPYYFDGIGQ